MAVSSLAPSCHPPDSLFRTDEVTFPFPSLGTGAPAVRPTPDPLNPLRAPPMWNSRNGLTGRCRLYTAFICWHSPMKGSPSTACSSCLFRVAAGFFFSFFLPAVVFQLCAPAFLPRQHESTSIVNTNLPADEPTCDPTCFQYRQSLIASYGSTDMPAIYLATLRDYSDFPESLSPYFQDCTYTKQLSFNT